MATLSQLLAVPALGLRLLQSGPGDPEMSWSSTTELLDLSAHLEGGEIILTTGLALAFDDPRWRDFVAALSRARVAAIGFGVGVNHDRVPPGLVLAASSYRVALFEVPPPTPFIAVSKAIARLLQADELRSARSAIQAQQRLLDGARDERSPAEILASIAQATGRHLALIAGDGRALASTAGFAAAQASGEAERIALDREGTLHLAIAGSEPLAPEGRAVLTAGAMVLGLELRGDHAATARERERWERLAAGLLSGELPPAAVSVLAPGAELPGRVRAIAVQGGAEDLAAWRRRPRGGLERLIAPGDAPDTPGLARAWQLVADDEAALARALETAALHDLDAVVGRPATLAEAPLSRRSAASRLRSLSPTAPLYTAPRVPEAVWADRDAPLLEALLATDGVPAAGTRSAAHRATEREAAKAPRPLTARVLGPLSAHVAELDASERTMLRETLGRIFRSDGQRGPAAQALGIHRNTLRDRLARIERLTGRSLADPDDRAELWFALRLEEIGG
ncbi:PucR family transcriptional regulator [Leucobacter allii]|uniref:PucR family transcriptional regulator n=1 Tax=Leucobacter allii TaxID=2932247 RepID=A0ABY4FJR9_9MICO|nr:PucR family transcriptional regulator [Leucobacter allii]UOQ56252.1 PucR family transcriptional regulator [Leucobacter allii]